MMRHGKDDSRAPRLTVLSNLVCVRTLGVVAIDVGERRIGPSSGRLFALLLYLVFRRGDATSRRVVQELLFPEATDGQAAHHLRRCSAVVLPRKNCSTSEKLPHGASEAARTLNIRTTRIPHATCSDRPSLSPERRFLLRTTTSRGARADATSARRR